MRSGWSPGGVLAPTLDKQQLRQPWWCCGTGATPPVCGTTQQPHTQPNTNSQTHNNTHHPCDFVIVGPQKVPKNFPRQGKQPPQPVGPTGTVRRTGPVVRCLWCLPIHTCPTSRAQYWCSRCQTHAFFAVYVACTVCVVPNCRRLGGPNADTTAQHDAPGLRSGSHRRTWLRTPRSAGSPPPPPPRWHQWHQWHAACHCVGSRACRTRRSHPCSCSCARARRPLSTSTWTCRCARLHRGMSCCHHPGR